MHALGKRLHCVQRFEIFANQEENGVTTLRHGHALDETQCVIIARCAVAKIFFDDDNVVVDLVEATVEMAVSLDVVDFVTHVGERGASLGQVFRVADSEQGRAIYWTYKIKFFHTLI